MLVTKKSTKRRKGAALIMAMIFMVVFSALAISMAQMSSLNVQMADNQQVSNRALESAHSGLECGLYYSTHLSLPETGYNYVTESQADQVWTALCSNIQSTTIGNGTQVSSFSDSGGAGQELVTNFLNYGNDQEFRIRYYRYNDEPFTINIQSIGKNNGVFRKINQQMEITKDSSVLNYAVASRGRMWLVGDSHIHGNIYSSWDREEISPFELDENSTVNGSINTCLTLDQIKDQYYQLETLDENDEPIYDEDGNKIVCTDDKIQGYNEGINYGVENNNMPGMDISDYDTDCYNDQLTNIPSSSNVQVEFFPHASGNYNYPRDGSPYYTNNRKLYRHVYQNQYFNNCRLPDDRNALFENCVFDGILYIDCYKSGNYHYNNVRFEDCVFRGVIITDVPQRFKWQNNCLYFTGEATFNNQSSIQEATILAPHFNVNLGNTNPDTTDNNILTGAIVGGIVDVRGNAQINGTIISMCDTTAWSSGYVTNIGATLDDGGSETTELGDIGTINITPDRKNMLPSGIQTPIVIKPVKDTYREV